MKTTALAILLASVASMSLATDVDDVSGTPTQQSITHIFDAANDLSNHQEDELPTLVQTVYDLWPNVTPGVVTTTEVPTVDSITFSGNVLNAITDMHTVTETGDDIVWRDIPGNRDITLMYIDGELFGTGKDVTNISVAGFRSVSSFMEGESAPSQVNDNEGIVGDAIDSVINVANTVNWNAVRAMDHQQQASQ